jgi:delta 1-pyrroline-5-carboxylate dehydrogenase
MVNSFNYLGNLISYKKEVDIDKFNYRKTVGIMNNVLRPLKTLKKTRIKLNDKLPLPALLYGNENWTIKGRDTRRITTAEMNYMRKTAGCPWTDYKTERMQRN